MELGKDSTFYELAINYGYLGVHKNIFKHFDPQSSDLDIGQI